LNPNARLVATGPKYAKALQTWVEGGGRVVVSPSLGGQLSWNSNDDDEAPQVDILDALGVGKLVSVGESSTSFVDDAAAAENDDETDVAEIEDDDFSVSELWSGSARQAPPSNRDVTLSGSLAPLAESVRELAIPGEDFRTLVAESDELAGTLTCSSPGAGGGQDLLVAVVQRGAGEIVIVADAAIFSNRLIARADNSVLAANLMSPDGRDVVFDEFYHGLAVRGNPLYLLTRPGFAAVTIGLHLLVAALAWRAAVFLGPPLADTRTKRRDIGEYVTAMADFFSRGRDSRRFIVHELRDGVLRQVCRELRLPMDTLDVDAITAALARRDRARAERLAATIREVDAQLALAGDYSRSSFLPVMQRLANCL
jgi:hypothetical protein